MQFILANMNEKLYSWTLKFRKVVRQKISDEVVDLTIALSAVHVWMRQWKNYWNWSTIAKIFVQIKVTYFVMGHDGKDIPWEQVHVVSEAFVCSPLTHDVTYMFIVTLATSKITTPSDFL